MIVFFFSVALTNLALGYALALYLHPELLSAESSVVDPLPVRVSTPVANPMANAEFTSRPAEPQTAVEDAIDSQTEAAAVEAKSSDDAPTTVAQLPDAITTEAPAEPIAPPVTQSTEPELPIAAVSLPVEPALEPQAESAAAADDHVADEPGDIIGCIERFASGLETYQTQLQEIAGRVQLCVEQPDAGAVQGCLRELRTMNYDYFEKQLEHSAQLAKLSDQSNTTIATNIDLAVTAQSACISDVDCALIELDPATDALASANQLLGEVAKLLGGCDKLTVALKPNDGEGKPAFQAATEATPLAAGGASA